MRRVRFRWFASLLVAAAALWTAVTVGTAVVRGEGHGVVFIGGVVFLGALLVGLVWLLSRLVPWKR